MFKDAILIAVGIALPIGGYYAWIGLKKGSSAVSSKVSSMWNAGVKDVTSRVSKLESDVSALKTKIGV